MITDSHPLGLCIPSHAAPSLDPACKNKIGCIKIKVGASQSGVTTKMAAQETERARCELWELGTCVCAASLSIGWCVCVCVMQHRQQPLKWNVGGLGPTNKLCAPHTYAHKTHINCDFFSSLQPYYGNRVRHCHKIPLIYICHQNKINDRI